MNLSSLILDHFNSKFLEIKSTLLKALNQLDDHQVNWRLNEQSNSIANLIVHIQGNVNQRIGTALLGCEDKRNRDDEFDTALVVSKDELVQIVTDSFDLVFYALNNLSTNDLFTEHNIRGKQRTTYEMLAQCVSHYSEHLGQILYIAKMCLGEAYATTSIYKPNKTLKFEAVIFDLDNTLINRKKAFRKFAEQFIDRFVVTSGPQQTNEMIEYFVREDRDGYRKKRELFTQLFKRFEMKNAETSVDELLECWFSEFYKCTVPMEGAHEVLVALKSSGIKLGLITNGSIHAQNSKIDEVNMRDYFDVIIVSDEVGLKKPDKRIFSMALEALKVNPQTAWYVGDHPINDVKGSRDAGLNSIWFEGFMAWDESVEKPETVISELGEIMNIVGVASNE